MIATPSQKKIITVVGARPQFIKAAALSPHLAALPDLQEQIVHTGQHFDPGMSDVFFDELGIPSPYLNLNIGGGSHGQNTGRMIEALERVFIDESPDAVLVFGDTDSTLAAAIAAAKLGIVLAHVEAGLRSYRRAMPEEINRVLTDHAADILYAPSQTAVDHLRQEGIHPNKIVMSGDVMQDSVRNFVELAHKRSTVLQTLKLEPGQYQLMTLHRKENVDDPAALNRILRGVAAAGKPTVFLVHPRTAKRIDEFGITLPDCIRTTPPQGYLEMLALIQSSSVVLTDSGGLQKEAYFLNKPCITLRDETEWRELVDAGANVLTGSDTHRIAQALTEVNLIAMPQGIYGHGKASEVIALDLRARLYGEAQVRQ
jgi:UDP-GlcNAc3NAcA epimerase